MARNARGGLGRGLSSLIGGYEAAAEESVEGLVANGGEGAAVATDSEGGARMSDEVAVERIFPNPDQPRRQFDPE